MAANLDSQAGKLMSGGVSKSEQQYKKRENDAIPEQLRLERQVCFPLYSVANAVTRAYRPLLKSLDLTYLQYIVMLVLWEEHEVNVKQLGERVTLDSGTLTPLLKRLETKGLVKRARSDIDERARIITVTAKGRKLQSKAIDIPYKVACSTGLSRDELEQIKSLCGKVLRKLNS